MPERALEARFMQFPIHATLGQPCREKAQNRQGGRDEIVWPGKKSVKMGVPVVAQWLTNPTRNHEVAGSVPALAQWVNDPVLP